jgi:hypothetical protein
VIGLCVAAAVAVTGFVAAPATGFDAAAKSVRVAAAATGVLVAATTTSNVTALAIGVAMAGIRVAVLVIGSVVAATMDVTDIDAFAVCLPLLSVRTTPPRNDIAEGKRLLARDATMRKITTTKKILTKADFRFCFVKPFAITWAITADTLVHMHSS